MSNGARKDFRLANLSDVHLPPLVGFSPAHWNAKRGLGWLNWALRRRAVHVRSALAAIETDLRAEAPDHIAVTGDLANLGLPIELSRAALWLGSLGPPDRVTVVPGNHDIYCRLWSDRGVARWADYMRGDRDDRLSDKLAPTFPFVRRRGPVGLVGLNSAVPTPPFQATGRIGAHQLQLAEDALRALRTEGFYRVVLIHHPPLPGQAPPSRALRNAEDVAGVLQRAGAELVLYGHNHRWAFEWLETATGPAAVVGIGSASAGIPHKGETLASYHLFRIAPAPGGRSTLEFSRRGLSRPNGPVELLESHILEAGQPLVPKDARPWRQTALDATEQF